MRTLHSALACVLPLVFFLATPVSAQGWGTVKGQVILAGKAPVQQQFINVPAQFAAACLKKGRIPKEDLVVDPQSRGVRWVVVWLAKDNNGMADHTADLPTHPALKAIKQKQVVMDQPCCRFEPHIAVLREGQQFVGKNSSAIPHNMNIVGNKLNRANSNNVVLAANTQQVMGKLPWKAYQLPSRVSCGIHPWMFGYIFVSPHPYSAVTDENGTFEIKNAPAGKFRLILWQESVGYLTSKNGKLITIVAGATTDPGKIELKPVE